MTSKLTKIIKDPLFWTATLTVGTPLTLLLKYGALNPNYIMPENRATIEQINYQATNTSGNMVYQATIDMPTNVNVTGEENNDN